MINKINPIYIEHAKLDSNDFIEVGSQLDRDLILAEAIAPDRQPTVVVTTSGMLAGGPVIRMGSKATARSTAPHGIARVSGRGFSGRSATETRERAAAVHGEPSTTKRASRLT